MNAQLRLVLFVLAIIAFATVISIYDIKFSPHSWDIFAGGVCGPRALLSASLKTPFH